MATTEERIESPTSAPATLTALPAPGNHAVRRSSKACDACRRRKVRCNGQQRCQQCAHLDIKCIYSPASQKRSRKLAAPRGTIIAACRSESDSPSALPQQTAPIPPLPTPPHLPLHQPPSLISQLSAPSPTATFLSDHSSPNSLLSPPRVPTFISRNLPTTFFLDLIPEYNAAVYPVNPVITEAEIRSCVNRMNTDSEALAFLYAMAAVTVNLSDVERVDARDRVSSLLASCFDHRIPLSHLNGPPTVFRVMTAIFIEICMMSLRKTDLGMMYLREAISLLEIMRIRDVNEMARLDRTERSRRERLYWECFIHERFAALSFDRAVLLDPLPHLPDFDPTIAYSIHTGWQYTIQTFLIIDRSFVDFWLRHRTPSADWLRQKHRQLEDDQWRIEVGSLSRMQQADIIVTRQWLRTMLWQMAISSLLLSTSEQDLSLTLPLQLSKELKSFLEHLSFIEVGVHGSGILHKLFEITNAITDVIVQLPDAPGEETRERVQDLLFLKKLVFSYPRLDKVHKRILEQKLAKIRGIGAREGMEDEGLGKLVEML